LREGEEEEDELITKPEPVGRGSELKASEHMSARCLQDRPRAEEDETDQFPVMVKESSLDDCCETSIRAEGRRVVF
jgi:hypothetical protein